MSSSSHQDVPTHEAQAMTEPLHAIRDRAHFTGGGCRARAWGYFRDLRASDPGCVRNQQAWNRIQETVQH